MMVRGRALFKNCRLSVQLAAACHLQGEAGGLHHCFFRSSPVRGFSPTWRYFYAYAKTSVKFFGGHGTFGQRDIFERRRE
jgi:hypothetical protein